MKNTKINNLIKLNSVCLIPARKNSKRIKNKNIKNFFGKPLIYYSIMAAKKSNLFQRIIVSTDCVNIKKIAESYGAEVPFIRPKKVSNDKATDISVVKHFLNFYSKKKIKFKYLCYLYPTNPLLKIKTLKKSFELLKKKSAQKTLTISKYEYPIQRALKNDNGVIAFREPKFKNSTSQSLENFYQDATQCYWYNLDKIINFNNFQTFKTYGYELSNTEFVDLNDNNDMKKLKFLFKYKNKKKFLIR